MIAWSTATNFFSPFNEFMGHKSFQSVAQFLQLYYVCVYKAYSNEEIFLLPRTTLTLNPTSTRSLLLRDLCWRET